MPRASQPLPPLARLANNAVDRVVVGVAAQARAMHQKFLDGRLIEPSIDRRAVMLEELRQRLAQRRA